MLCSTEADMNLKVQQIKKYKCAIIFLTIGKIIHVNSEFSIVFCGFLAMDTFENSTFCTLCHTCTLQFHHSTKLTF